MRALDRIVQAKIDFDGAWRAHAVALRSVQLVVELPNNLDGALQETLSQTDGLEAGFDTIFPLEHLRFEAQQVQDSDYFLLRRNCLLGVCASFEDYVKTVAAALTYEPEWRTLKEGERLRQETDFNFHLCFASQDKAWQKCPRQGTYFFRPRFEWLTDYTEDRVREVFWFRNQLSHNANMARGKSGEDKRLELLDQTFRHGEKLGLDSRRLRLLTHMLDGTVRSIADELPFLEATLR